LKRKKGADTKIEEFRVMSVPLKIRMFSATDDKKDYYKAHSILEEIKKDLEGKIIKVSEEEAPKKKIQKEDETKED
jgi:hypothetical protein